MGREKHFVKLKLDIIFKKVFGDKDNKEALASLLSALLEIPMEEIGEITLDNVEMPPEMYETKFSRLDLKLTLDGRVIDIEIQITNQEDFKERSLFYWAKMFSKNLKAGDEYKKLPQTICINIINFNMFDCEDYLSTFEIFEKSRHERLTDRLSINFFELKKVGKYPKNKPMDEWLTLINAESEEDLMSIEKSTTNEAIKNVVVKLREYNADERVQLQAEIREEALHEEASRIASAMNEGKAEGRAEEKKKNIEQFAAILKSLGHTDEQIAEAMKNF